MNKVISGGMAIVGIILGVIGGFLVKAGFPSKGAPNAGLDWIFDTVGFFGIAFVLVGIVVFFIGIWHFCRKTELNQ